MATKNPASRDLLQAYERAQRSEHVSAKEFLDIVAPSKRGRSEASAKRYINKLRTGERSGTQLLKRAQSDSGKRVNVSFRDEHGFVTSANLIIPYGSSRLDIFRPSKTSKRKSRLRVAAETYISHKYKNANVAGMKLLGVRSISRAKAIEIIR
jgi:hypothetical protein